MARVAFRTKRGKKISFTTHPGRSRTLSAYQRHVQREMKKALRGVPSGQRLKKARTAMKAAAKSWKAK